jgi:integrase
MKSRKGYVFQTENGSWYARFTYTDKGGKRRNVKRTAKNKSQAESLLKELVREFDVGGEEQLCATRITLNDLCDYYETHYACEAIYVNGRKVSGLRSVLGVRGYIKVFREHFGRQKLKEVTYEDLRNFRNERLATSTHQSKQRSLATVNREMAYLRRVLNIAERNGWVSKNPFLKGDSLIPASDEIKRERILSRDEESRLLDACIGRRSHLKPLIIAALDTGCRRGELLKLRWTDIDFEIGVITICAFNTKTMRERQISITARLRKEFQILAEATQNESDLVFGVTTEVRKSFRSACSQAGIEGLRFHDLRHTHASRLDDLGFSLAKIGGQLGHTVLQTTLRYVNRDSVAVLQVANALNAFNENSSFLL